MMNREEKIQLAEECRKQGAFRPVDPEVLDALPVQPLYKKMPANERGVDTYIFDGSQGKENRPLFINLHGGGFIKGRADRDTVYCSGMADLFQAVIWDIDYVLAPEYPFPAAAHEAYDIVKYAYKHAEEYGFNKDCILLLGHSAGSNLACAALTQNYYRPAFSVKGLLLDYNPADQRLNPFSKIRREDFTDERRLSRALTEYRYLELYMEPQECVNELASPAVLSDEVLSSYPDTLVITAALDSLMEEGEAFAKRLANAGVAVTLKRFTRSPHGFTINRTGEWEDGLELHKRFIKSLI